MIVADKEAIVRLDASGNIARTYDATEEDSWFAINLDPDGTSFWSAGLRTGNIYKFNLATGNQLLNFNTGTPPTSSGEIVGGLVVFGEIIVGGAQADLALTQTATPNPVAANSNLTYTLTVANNGPDSTSFITVTDNLPAEVSFVSCTATGGGVCGGSGNNRTVSFASLASGASATVTLIARANCPAATISNTATVSAPTTTDINPGNNTATATTAVSGCGSCPAIGAISPTSGAPGTTVTINGTNLTGVNSVKFASNLSATFVVLSDTQLTAIVPLGAVTGPITLSKPNCNDVQTTIFTVTSPPTGRIVRVVDSSGAPGGQVAVPIELVAQGNENALGFSLNFNSAILSNPQAVPGSGASGASLNLNSSQLAQGRLGLALALPAGQTFAVGTRQIIVVTFTIAASVNVTSTPVTFGNQPIAREISDLNAVALQASYIDGTVSFTTGYEADVAPRPNGNNNGTVTITDWVQVGRFAAGLDTPAPGSEFQRADCAPRETKGNGIISITDWVQAGRYAAGLDPVMTAGGPTSLSLVEPGERLTMMTDAVAHRRKLRIANTTFLRGRTNTVAIELDAQGNENALGFSINFNPSAISFASATLGEGLSGGALNINTLQAADGRIGIAFALPAGQKMAAGTSVVVRLNFNIVNGSNTTMTEISFNDHSIKRQVADADAASLEVEYVDAVIEIAGNRRVGRQSQQLSKLRDVNAIRHPAKP